MKKRFGCEWAAGNLALLLAWGAMAADAGAESHVVSGATWKYFSAGSAPGASWPMPAFDDSSWASGPSQLGFGDGDEATVLPAGIVTAYFRTKFNVIGADPALGLTLRVLRDDGVVVYLNGVEVFRNNLPPGPLSYATLATVAVGGPEETTLFLSANLSSSLLLEGVNVIAAEVHQVNVVSSDLSFDLELLSGNGPPPPDDLPIVSVVAADNSAAEQNPVLAQVPNPGLFRVSRTGPTTEALHVSIHWSGTAVNGVDCALLPLELDIPAGSSSLDLAVEVTDDNLVEGTEALTLNLPQPPCANQVPPAAGCYVVGASAQATVHILDNDSGPTPPDGTPLIAANSIWKYLDNGTDQGAAWRAPGFDDSAWASGAGQLGYGDGDEATVVSFGPDAANKYITTYFRRAFEVTNASAISNLVLRVLRDDGVVVYLNGIEVFRNNLPPGPITFNTLATAVAGDENAYLEISLPADPLVTGGNVVAAEVHQINPVSSDVGFDLELATGAGSLNQPPQVVMTSPSEGATFFQGGTIRLEASASDADGSVVSVEFFANNQSLGFGQANGGSSYRFDWTGIPPGVHLLGARAIDAQGAQNDAATVRITVEGEPPNGERELHLIGIYSGAAPEGGPVHNNEFGDASVSVNRPGKLVSLFLTSYEPVHWHVSVAAGTSIERIFLSSYYTNTVDGIPENVPVTRERVGYAYSLGSIDYLQMLPRVCALTGQSISSFHGSYAAPYPSPFVIDSLQNDPRLQCGFPQPEPTNNLPALSFRLSFYDSARGLYFLNYTLAGPDGGGNAIPDAYMVPDATGRYYYSADPHSVWKLDSQTGSAQGMSLPSSVPELSWPMGAAYDLQRDRMLLVSLGGEGFLYAYSPSQDAWSLLASMDNLDLDALVHHSASDSLFGLGIPYSEGGPKLHEFSPDGAPRRFIQLPELPFRIGPGSFHSELVSVGDYLIWLIGPRYAWQSEQESRMYLIDPRTGQVWLTYRQTHLPPLDRDGDGVPDWQDQCPDSPANAMIDEHGCSIAEASPCDGPWTNHAEYVRSIIRAAWQSFRANLITADQRRALVREAVRSDCGRRNAPEPIQLHLLPLTPSECHRDGMRWVLSGDAIGECALESSTDLIHWTTLQTLDPAEMGDEIACPHSEGEPSRFFRIRTGAP